MKVVLLDLSDNRDGTETQNTKFLADSLVEIEGVEPLAVLKDGDEWETVVCEAKTADPEFAVILVHGNQWAEVEIVLQCLPAFRDIPIIFIQCGGLSSALAHHTSQSPRIFAIHEVCSVEAIPFTIGFLREYATSKDWKAALDAGRAEVEDIEPKFRWHCTLEPGFEDLPPAV